MLGWKIGIDIKESHDSEIPVANHSTATKVNVETKIKEIAIAVIAAQSTVITFLF